MKSKVRFFWLRTVMDLFADNHRRAGHVNR
jgi:hypothetical protein